MRTALLQGLRILLIKSA